MMRNLACVLVATVGLVSSSHAPRAQAPVFDFDTGKPAVAAFVLRQGNGVPGVPELLNTRIAPPAVWLVSASNVTFSIQMLSPNKQTVPSSAGSHSPPDGQVAAPSVSTTPALDSPMIFVVEALSPVMVCCG